MKESTLFSIKEFAEFTGTNQSTLRYYDEIGILPPASRGENNYRYYMPFQIVKLNYINVLVDLGVPLSVIKDMNETRTPETVVDLLGRQEIKLDQQLHELQTAYSIIHTYRQNIAKGLAAKSGSVSVEELEECQYILGRVTDTKFKKDETFYEEFIRFCKSADRYRINLRYPVGGYHENMEVFLESPNRPDKFFSLDPTGNYTRPGGKYLVGYKRGFYGEFDDTPKRMAAYAEENELVCKGPVFVVYLLDEISIAEPDGYLASVSVAVAPKKPPRPKRGT